MRQGSSQRIVISLIKLKKTFVDKFINNVMMSLSSESKDKRLRKLLLAYKSNDANMIASSLKKINIGSFGVPALAICSLMFKHMMISKRGFEYLVSILADINLMRTYDASYTTLLHDACSINDDVAVGVLLNFGADANHVTKYWGENALHIAVKLDTNEYVKRDTLLHVLQMLLLAGVDAHAKSNWGLMPGEHTPQKCVLGEAARSFARNCY